MKKFLLIALALALVLPVASQAKTNKPKGYESAKGGSITVTEPLGWPVSVSAKVGKLNGSIESLPGMTIIRVKAYKSWYNVFTTIPATSTLLVRGLPANKELHIYTNGYRVHEKMISSASGTLTIDRPTGRGMQVIIKERPSTYHIQVGGLINPAGGDCSTIGVWNATTKTCTLNRDITDSIVVDDDGITIDGNNHTSTGPGIAPGDGIYTDQSNVTVKRLTLRSYSRGVVFADSFFSIAPSGGTADTVTIIPVSTGTGLVVDDIPGVHVNKVTVTGGNIGVRLVDTTDLFFSTDDLQFTNGRVSAAQTAVLFVGIEGVLLRGNMFDANTTGVLSGTVDRTVTAYQNNFKNNTADFSGLSGTVVWQGTATQRGNYWSRNGATTCTQSGNTCTNSFSTGYGTDAYPWACENAWVPGVVCPVVPPATGSRWGEIHSSAGTAKLYSNAGLTTEVKTLPNEWALLVFDPASNPVQVKDVTDDTVGYLRAADLTIASAGSARETELRDNASHIYDTRSTRVPVILDAVNIYHNNPNGVPSLYDPAGGIDGGNRFHDFIIDENFPRELMLAVFADETGGYQFDNQICNVNLDGGIGIAQITSPDFKGRGSALLIESKVNDCNKLAGWDISKTKSSYYSNSKQGIYANIKDGYRTMQAKYKSYWDHVDNYTPAKSSWFGTGMTSVTNGDLKKLLAVRGYNGFGDFCYRFNNEKNYPRPVADALENLNTYFPGETYANADHLIEKLKLAEENKETISICSPGILQILDENNRITGYSGVTMLQDVPNVVYDESTKKSADILFPQENYKIRVIGDQSGAYTLHVTNSVNSNEKEFTATAIPTQLSAVQEFSIDWNSLTDTAGVTVRVDQNGDGIFEKTLSTGRNLTAEQFSLAAEPSSVTICHRPPGNSSNAHTITVGESAVRAHIAHGDTMGACGSVTMTSTTVVKISPGQAKKELNTASGGFVPPGQAKKNKK